MPIKLQTIKDPYSRSYRFQIVIPFGDVDDLELDDAERSLLDRANSPTATQGLIKKALNLILSRLENKRRYSL